MQQKDKRAKTEKKKPGQPAKASQTAKELLKLIWNEEYYIPAKKEKKMKEKEREEEKRGESDSQIPRFSARAPVRETVQSEID